MKLTNEKTNGQRIIKKMGVTFLAAILYSCNLLPGGGEDNSKLRTNGGILAVLAATQKSSSGRAALVMPDCGKGLFTGDTYNDFAKYSTLFITGYGAVGIGGAPGCTPKSISNTFPQSATLTYTANRQVATYTISGSTTTYSYNGLNYILKQSKPCTIASAGNSTRDYSYDDSGRIIKATTTEPSGCTSGSAAFLEVDDYTYTGSDLLPTASTFTYNSGVCKTTSTYTITKTTQGWREKLINNSSSSGTARVETCIPGSSYQFSVTYTYDSNGNILTDTSVVSASTNTFTYTFDSSGRIATYTAAGTTTSYTYNSSGHLISSVSGSTTTTYSY